MLQSAVRAFLLLAAIAASLLLAWLLRQQYRQTVRVQLDPTAASKFTRLNADLAPPKPGDKRVVFFGTSHIELWQLPAISGCQMVNRGQSYDTSEQLRLRLERDVLALKPDIVFFEGGTNDLKAMLIGWRHASVKQNFGDVAEVVRLPPGAKGTRAIFSGKM
jgi:hypothetical protein